MYIMDMQISHSICAEVPPSDHLQKDKSGRRKNTKRAERKKRSKDHRGGMLPGSCTYAFGDTAKDEGVGIHRISERKKCNNDIRAIRGTEV